ncbi:phospholipid-translocating P-type ATPase [Aspergillus brunneoviolaceus CBS 621.78]|uniref:Phospholipid-translocating P-type ATPase n=1 Tax=Aspergillus brunneoviolaceus CBS 621.78 TaxID=1450534 RepID=A0ACD1G2J0_9EURO|nr:phospholipid-translocating P-type ATPase [Aspergillus brunneoviolaceus CBS 621.78]RAH43483.1 phospholipid-translocating P-type ATPase [Aspergillus brunneoviolaceus CBS 621.78]
MDSYDGKGENGLERASSEVPPLPSSSEEDANKKSTKRARWATKRMTAASGLRKRVSILERGRRQNQTDTMASATAGVPEITEGESGSRKVHFNLPIPDEERDEEGNLKAVYPRNKIRTAIYTPLTFIPKNLWLQFHNIANLYFLFVIILQCFEIFGDADPGLSAVPLIVIVVVTAVKDAIEDWRRTVSDNELNNSPVYRLTDWDNVNVTADNVSLWRKFKKACTRAVVTSYRGMKRLFRKNGADKDVAGDVEMADARPSIEPTSPIAIEMTAVSPTMEARASGDWPDPMNDHDQQANSPWARTKGSVLNPNRVTPGKARFKRQHWKDVNVGDFVRLYNGDQIPADIAILSTSDPDGACYVETKNLDGETNLKVRNALNCGRVLRNARDCEKAEFTVESPPAHANLYSFSGAIYWDQYDESGEAPQNRVEPITINNILLRGCSLQNTEWVLGVVLFTGPETKIMLNQGLTPSKRPQMARNMNWNVVYNFAILFIMCVISGFINGFAWGLDDASLTFFEYGSYGGTPAVQGVIAFFVGVVLFQNLVPIALYISLEICRVIQALYIYYDIHMYYERLKMSCVPRSWNISDDIGQIEYIFSDKTGTLTQNVMEFKKCTVNGVPYGEAYTEAQLGMQRRQGLVNVEEEAAKARQRISEARVEMIQQLRQLHDNPYLKEENLTFVAPQFAADLGGASGEAQQQATIDFMTALALCHTVVTERIPGDPPQIEFKAQSPDEAALVATARDCGFTTLGRSGESLILNIMGDERRYTILNILEFNSTRKRMSVIVQMPDGTIRLLCKGADTMIYSRLAPGQQRELRDATTRDLETFAQEGLRVLCIAERTIEPEEYREWSVMHDAAAAAIVDREEKLEEVSNAIEQNLYLLGGTAIEDRLQDGVPDTISLLAEAGIKLWVLTGDKIETAINIGFSCNLLNNDMQMIVFDAPSDIDMAAKLLDSKLEIFGITGSDEELEAARKDHSPPPQTHALVLDGDTLRFMLDDALRQKFLLLCRKCKSVLCCRVSPAQKAAVVEMVKNGLNVMALAIGDGANDVSMIQKADVGVGIAGEEGRQAVMSADYAIGQFRFLQRLILVHGRWAYRRLGETTANFFYKNLVWTFALFWYSIYDNFDGTYLFEYTYITLVNVAFTSLPVIFMGIFDQDVDDRVSMAVPQLYMRGIERKEWTQLKFWIYMLDGFYQSIICFFMPYMLYQVANFQTENGMGIDDIYRVGVLVATCAVVTSNTYVMMNMYRWDWFSTLINAISSLLIFFWTGIYSSFESSATFYGAAKQVYGALSFWVVFLLTVVICLTPRFVCKCIQKVYFPMDVDIIREKVILGHYDYLKQYDAYVPPDAGKLAGSSESGASATTSDPENTHQTTVPRHYPGENNVDRTANSTPVAPLVDSHGAPTRLDNSQFTSANSSVAFGLQRNTSWDSASREQSVLSGPVLPVDSTSMEPQQPHSPLKSRGDPPSTYPV